MPLNVNGETGASTHMVRHNKCNHTHASNGVHITTIKYSFWYQLLPTKILVRKAFVALHDLIHKFKCIPVGHKILELESQYSFFILGKTIQEQVSSVGLRSCI